MFVYYTDDGSLELGSEMSGLVAYLCNVLIILEMFYFAEVYNVTMPLFLVILLLRLTIYDNRDYEYCCLSRQKANINKKSDTQIEMLEMLLQAIYFEGQEGTLFCIIVSIDTAMMTKHVEVKRLLTLDIGEFWIL